MCDEHAGLTLRSPAKINWSLRVLHRRADGFHEIESLVTAVTLFDELTFVERGDGVSALDCDHPDVPLDERNLVLKAAALLAEASGAGPGFTCRLVKQIPLGGGLGGGSSNGATALLGLNRLWGLNWPVERLAPLAARLGSDVSFFLHGRTAVISGRGEKVRPVRLGWSGWLVLLLPPLSVSTPAVYRAWRPGLNVDPPGPIEGRTAGTAAAWMQGTYNMLEAPAVEVCPDLGRLLNEARRLADRPVRVSGSGSTMYTAFDESAEAEAFRERVCRVLGIRAQVVQPLEQATCWR